MGSVIGGIVGGIGSLVGGFMQSNAANKASEQAQQGFNFLTKGYGGNATRGFVTAGGNANDQISQLLGASPMKEGTSNAFNKYLDSTAYNFQRDEGMNALNSNAAARGLLNSGGAAKGVVRYGQNLAGTTFNNYLNQLGSVANRGQASLAAVGGVGANSGANAGQFTAAGGNAMASGLTGALGSFTNAFIPR